MVSGEYMDWDFSSFHLDKIKHRILNAEEFPNNLLTKEDKNLDYIITTRLDSDDMLHKDYVNNIQNNSEIDCLIDHNDEIKFERI